MKFEDFEYVRPNIDEFGMKIKGLINDIMTAKDSEKYMMFVEEVNILRREIKSMMILAEIRHSIDTNDSTFKKEQDYVDEVAPLVDELDNQFILAVIGSDFFPEIEKKIGIEPFKKVRVYLNTFKPEILEDLKEENKLKSEYSKLVASAKVVFEGEEMNLANVMKFAESKNRDTRKNALSTYFSFFEENEEAFEEIFSNLVSVRTRISKKLGYDNFIPVAYSRLKRIDFDSKMVLNLRDSIVKYIVPINSSLKEEQRKRLGIEKLKYYDEPLIFYSGNAQIKEGINIIHEAKEMFDEMSPQTGVFFDFMIQNELMDLKTKNGKKAGAYCEFIPKYKSPFVFCNFKGNSEDINELTHESGHAFDCYVNREDTTKDFTYCGYETAEVHSMSMEFFAENWTNRFFDDFEKYNYVNFIGSLFFLPYGCLVDEFQHFVYENYEASPKQRKAKYKELEKKYLPHKDYDDNEFLKSGGYFYRQPHYFLHPFYYIDYVIAQVCALQFWERSKIDFKEAFLDYLSVVKGSDTRGFLKSIEVGNLKNPFLSQTLSELVISIEKYLKNVDFDKLESN